MSKTYEEYLNNALDLAEKSEVDQENQGSLIQEALYNLDQAYILNPLDDRAPFHKGVFLYRQEKPQEALKALKLSFELDSYDPETFYYLAMVNQELGNTNKAQNLLWQAIYLCCNKENNNNNVCNYAYNESSTYINHLESMLGHSHPACKTLEIFQFTGDVSVIKDYLIQNCADLS